jgi:hypothetical protein
MRTLPPDVGDGPMSLQPDEPTSFDLRQEADRSNATRYLCVGAEIDSSFADQVIREVLQRFAVVGDL